MTTVSLYIDGVFFHLHVFLERAKFGPDYQKQFLTFKIWVTPWRWCMVCNEVRGSLLYIGNKFVSHICLVLFNVTLDVVGRCTTM